MSDSSSATPDEREHAAGWDSGSAGQEMDSGWPSEDGGEVRPIPLPPTTAGPDSEGETVDMPFPSELVDRAGDEDETETGPRCLATVLQGGPLAAYLIPGSRLGPYLVEAEVGRGGAGAVFRARHTELDRLVALKVLLAGVTASRRQRKRFLREGIVGAHLLHSGIVRVHDYGEEDGLPYLALEYVEGTTLHRELPKLGIDELVRLLVRVGRALEVAHADGVVHRDLKPANVLIRQDGSPVVTDFGLARDLRASSGLTQVGTAVGTPYYMSPEQTRGKKPAPPIDVFALGVILYQGLTGKMPFDGTSNAQLYTAINTHQPPPPSSLNPEAPAALDWVCARALEKDPARRYAHGGQFAADLEAFLRGDPVVPRRPLIAGVTSGILLGVLALVLAAVLAADRSDSGDPPSDPGDTSRLRLQRLPPPDDPLPDFESGSYQDGFLVTGSHWAAGHGLSLEEVERRTAELEPRGFALERIRVDQGAPPRMAVIWSQGRGLGRAAHLDLTLEELEAKRAEYRSRDFRPVDLESYGPYPQERYAATWVRAALGSRQHWTTRLRLTSDELAGWRTRLAQAGSRIVSLAITRGSRRRYAASAVRDGVAGFSACELTAKELAAVLVRRAREGYRLVTALAYETAQGRLHAGVWQKDGREALSFFGLSPDEHQFALQCLAHSGYEPVCVTEYGHEPERGFATCWARDPARREWRTTGSQIDELAALDPVVRAHMVEHRVSCGALAVTHQGRLILARGYTWAPPSHAITQPRSLFRLGALSMPLTAVGVLRLVEADRLDLNATLGQLLPEAKEEGWDPRFKQVTVGHLLSHRGGWDRHVAAAGVSAARSLDLYDPTTGLDRALCRALGQEPPLTPQVILDHVRSQPLEFDPGARHAFSHLGYMILGRVIEQVSERAYVEHMEEEVLARIGRTDLQIGGSRLHERARGEVVYEGDLLARDVFGSDTVGPAQYHGLNLGAAAAHNGWIGSVVGLARFLAALDEPAASPLLGAAAIEAMWTPPPGGTYALGWRVGGPPDNRRASHEGRLPGTWAYMERTGRGASFVLLFNRDAPGVALPERIRRALADVELWPAHDLFEDQAGEDRVPDGSG